MIAAIPVKPFAAAKQRLASVLPPDAREVISREMAQRTLHCVALAGADPVVLAADDEVEDWAGENGWAALLDRGSDLNRAAQAAVEMASAHEVPWLIVHADLPLLEPATLIPAIRALSNGVPVISPSRDGGTTLIGAASHSFRFSYGSSSFQRHLHEMRTDNPVVLVDARLAIDLDDPSDLAFAASRVGWLAQLLDTLPAR